MITISLDEKGNFENEDDQPLFISGMIYDDKGADSSSSRNEKLNERKRIRAYYCKAISDAGNGFLYSEDLHSNEDKERDYNVIVR